MSYDPTRDVPLMCKPGTTIPTKLPTSFPLPILAAPVARIPDPPRFPPPPRFAEVSYAQAPPRQPFLRLAREIASRIWRSFTAAAPASARPQLPPR